MISAARRRLASRSSASRSQVTEAILGHTSGSRAGIIGVYQRHNYAAEKRAALEASGAYVTALVE